MIKKIKVAHLKPGMFVHDFECGWLENPFFKNHVLLKDEAMIEKVVLHGIQEVMIDTEKGIDADRAVLPAEQLTEEIPDEIEMPDAFPVVSLIGFEKRLFNIVPTELKEELPGALILRGEMEAVMDDIFRNVTSGKSFDVTATMEVSKKMVESVFRNDTALPCIAKVHTTKNYFVSRALNVSTLMIAFAKHLGIVPPEIVDLAVGSLLHDIGMLKIDQGLVEKAEKLTQKEFEGIKMHVLFSYEIVSEAAGDVQPALHMALLHHERFDGSGYPHGAKGEQIPKAARMLAIADIFDAMTTPRVYSGAINLSAANRKLLEMASLQQIDEALTQHFIRCIGIYPVGTIVRLSSGKLGIVIKQNHDSLLTPVVKVIYDGKKDCFVRPRNLNLADLPEGRENEKITSAGWEKSLKINPIDFLLA